MSNAPLSRDWRADYIARQRRVAEHFQRLLASPHTPLHEHAAIQKRIDDLAAEIRESQSEAAAYRYDAMAA